MEGPGINCPFGLYALLGEHLPGPAGVRAPANRDPLAWRPLKAPSLLEFEVIATEAARQRWPAQPKAESAMMRVVMSMSASGITTTGFFAPPWHCARLPLAVARL